MFDIFRSRDKAVRIVLGGLLGLIALSMLLYLIPGAGMTTGASGNGEVVAEIGNEKVTSKDIQELVQERMQSRQIPPDMLQFLLPQLIDQRISDIAVAYQAKRMGFEVSDAALADAIRAFPNVGTMTDQQYAAYIQQMGMTVPEFEANMRKRMITLQLLNTALEGVVVTPQEVQNEFSRRNEKIKLEYVAFDPQKLKSEVNPTPQDLQTFFTQMRGLFAIPETRTADVIVADPQRIAETLQISDNQVQQYYNSNKDQFRTPERVKVRHILLTTTGKSKDEIAKIEAKANDLLKQVKSGGDFAAIAKANSEDPGSKINGGDLGWVVRGQTVKNFESSAFSLKPNEISNLVTTEYGFHILQVQEKQEAHLQSLDEVKPQIAAELKKGSLNDRVQTLADQARTQIAKAPGSAAEIAAKLGLSYGKAEKIRSGESVPFVGADKTVSSTIFGMKKGEVSQVMQAGDRLVITVLDDVFAPRSANFEEVEGQVRERYQSDQALKIMNDRAKQAADMLKSNGGDVQAVAKKFGVEAKTTDFFNRQGAAEGIGSANYFTDMFLKPVGSVSGAVNVGPQTIVAKIVDKQASDPAKLAGERESIIAQLKGKKAEERGTLFEDSIMTKLLAEGKVKIHKDVINRIIARYRG